MRKDSYIRFVEPATLLKKLADARHTLSFRLTVWYAGIFTVSLFAAFAMFYVLVLHGSHNISREALSALREDFREYFGTMLVCVIVASALIGWAMAKRALSGVEEISRVATAISGGALESRVPLKGRRDEIDRLAGNFNSMVERMENLIKEMKEMNDNIAHDLRSPITRMRGFAEVTLTGSNSLPDYRAMASTVLEECDRLLAMINTMLDISEAETGLAALDLQRVDIEDMIRDVIDLFSPVIDAKGLRTSFQGVGPLIIEADVQKIQRVLSNLLDNAIKYTPQGGSIEVKAVGTDDEVRITVKDAGIGIPGPDLPHVFDRFFRGEKSRSEPGSGLGLSLARALVVAHGGKITATSAPGKGSQFFVILPKAQA